MERNFTMKLYTPTSQSNSSDVSDSRLVQIELESLALDREIQDINATTDSIQDGNFAVEQLASFIDAYDSDVNDAIAKVTLESIAGSIGLELDSGDDWVEQAEVAKEGIGSTISKAIKALWHRITSFFVNVMNNSKDKDKFVKKVLKQADFKKAAKAFKDAKTTIKSPVDTTGTPFKTYLDKMATKTLKLSTGELIYRDGKVTMDKHPVTATNVPNKEADLKSMLNKDTALTKHAKKLEKTHKKHIKLIEKATKAVNRGKSAATVDKMVKKVQKDVFANENVSGADSESSLAKMSARVTSFKGFILYDLKERQNFLFALAKKVWAASDGKISKKAKKKAKKKAAAAASGGGKKKNKNP